MFRRDQSTVTRDDVHGQVETGDRLTRLKLIVRESFVVHNCAEEFSMNIHCAYHVQVSFVPPIEYGKKKKKKENDRIPTTHKHIILHHEVTR